jgi:hypothetical protein
METYTFEEVSDWCFGAFAPNEDFRSYNGFSHNDFGI